MAIAFVTSVAAKSTNSNGFTTGTCDTTGANLLAAVQGYYHGGGAGTITDSKGNSWSNLTAYVDTSLVSDSRTSYSTPTVVGSGHTFSVSGSGNYPALAVLAFSGAKASSPFDVENGATAISQSPAAGSVTPSEDNEVLVAGMCWNQNLAPITAIDGGFTLQHNQLPVASQCVGSCAAYLIQTTATAANPTWTMSVGANAWTANIATFKVAAAAGSAIKTIMGLALASVKAINGLAIASVKTVNGLA